MAGFPYVLLIAWVFFWTDVTFSGRGITAALGSCGRGGFSPIPLEPTSAAAFPSSKGERARAPACPGLPSPAPLT